jgi:hypothetical protein
MKQLVQATARIRVNQWTVLGMLDHIQESEELRPVSTKMKSPVTPPHVISAQQ